MLTPALPRVMPEPTISCARAQETITKHLQGAIAKSALQALRVRVRVRFRYRVTVRIRIRVRVRQRSYCRVYRH